MHIVSDKGIILKDLPALKKRFIMFEGVSLEFNEIFIEFLDYLIQQGYGEDRTGFLEGVVQRAFFDDWIKFLAYQREVKGPFSIISEMMDKKEE